MEVIVTGGGAFIVDVLNAVAAFTGSGSFASFIRVVLIFSMCFVCLSFVLLFFFVSLFFFDIVILFFSLFD